LDERRAALIEYYVRRKILGFETARFENFEYYVDNKEILVISRIYHHAKTETLIIPEEFDDFEATLLRKSLKYLDLGKVSKTNVVLRCLPNIETFIAKNLSISYTPFERMLYGATKLKYLNLDKMPYLSYTHLISSKETLLELSLKSVKIISKAGLSGCYELQKITLGNSLKKIDEGAFRECINLKTIDFYGTREQFDNIDIASGNQRLKGLDIHFLTE